MMVSGVCFSAFGAGVGRHSLKSAHSSKYGMYVICMSESFITLQTHTTIYVCTFNVQR